MNNCHPDKSISTKATIDVANQHTIKKFELIEEYVKAWAQKLLNYQGCDGVVFIDCMCNSGIYQDGHGSEIFGTPIRVANYLSNIMQSYPDKNARLIFNDCDAKKISILQTHLPANTTNFNIVTNVGDGNDLLKKMDIPKRSRVNYLLIYDPYTASIDWEALMPFLQNWGEIIINHMVSDSVRGIPQACRDTAVEKYEQTYLTTIQELTAFGSDKATYEARIQEIITFLRGKKDSQYYIASFPFFRGHKNELVYHLLHCTGNIKGFKLFKQTAWKIFGGKSSSKNTRGTEKQTVLDFDGIGTLRTSTDEHCYYVKDIAEYLSDTFAGQANVPLNRVWETLDKHPVFPSDGFKTEIRNELRDNYKCEVSRQDITFAK